MQLFYQQYGNGFPLIILHGLLGASGNWHSLSRNVFANHFNVFAIDLRNHGRSPHHDIFDFPHMVADVVQFMDDQGLAEAHVLGHSMGGKVAMWLAREHPDRVKKLISADIAPRTYPPHHMHILNGLKAVEPHRYTSRSEIDEALAGHIDAFPVRQFLLKNLELVDGVYRWKMNLDAIYRQYPRINEGIETTLRFEKPALFIKGGKSNYITEQDKPMIEALFKDVQYAELPDAGHWLHAESPEAFASAVLNFLI